MAVNLGQVKELLGNGLSADTVASAVGCSPSYITQLLSDEDFAADVTALRVTHLSANTARDKKIDGIEDKILNALSERMDSGAVYKVGDLLNAFRIVNSAKRRGVAADTTVMTNNTTIIPLYLPTKAASIYTTTITPQGEVVQVGEQNLTTMSAASLLKTLAASTPERAKRYTDVERFLPSPVTSKEGGT